MQDVYASNACGDAMLAECPKKCFFQAWFVLECNLSMSLQGVGGTKGVL